MSGASRSVDEIFADFSQRRDGLVAAVTDVRGQETRRPKSSGR
jgi:hypothetical protein